MVNYMEQHMAYGVYINLSRSVRKAKIAKKLARYLAEQQVNASL
jgi:hypothetical protein